jgi:hypothetical protein
LLFKIIIEVVFVALIFIFGTYFWQSIKRSRRIKEYITNISYLRNFISPQLFSHIPDRLSVFSNKIGNTSYVINIKFLMQSEKRSSNIPRFISLILILIMLTVSYFFGIVFLIITLVIFLLFSLFPLSESGELSVCEHIEAFAYILYKWIEENPNECDDWVKDAYTIQPLYNAVKNNCF